MPTYSTSVPGDDDAILRRPAVEAMTGVSRTAIYLLIKQGLFPKPVVLGPRRRGWRLAEVRAWLASRPHGLGPAPPGQPSARKPPPKRERERQPAASKRRRG